MLILILIQLQIIIQQYPCKKSQNATNKYEKVESKQICILDSDQDQYPQIKNQKKQQIKDSVQEKEKQQIINVQEYMSFIPVYEHKNYQSHIKPVLQKISNYDQQKQSIDQIIKAITYFRQQFLVRRQNKFSNGKPYKNNDFSIIVNYHTYLAIQVFTKASKFILQNQKTQQFYRIPVFQSNKQLTKTISKWQVLFIMCSMSLCLITQQKIDNSNRNHRFTHLVQFSEYFTSNQWKSRCLLGYLKTQLNNYFSPKPNSMNQRMLTISRLICQTKLSRILNKNGNKTIKSISIPNDDVTIDDFYQQLKICHTNDYLGGGQNLQGLSQQDIFFSAHTQLHILLVLCQKMNIQDCVHLVGFRKYFRIQRTRYQIIFDGQDNQYPLEMDLQGRIKDYISFVNHPKFVRENFIDQFQKSLIQRQIAVYFQTIKSFQQLLKIEFKKVISGHWANTLRWGDARKKMTNLWIASSMMNKDLTFCSYGEFKVIYDKDFIYKMKGVQCNQAYKNLIIASKKMRVFKDNLHVYILALLHRSTK